MSVRLESTATYETAVMVFDVRHMPQGCGTWPAVWTCVPSISISKAIPLFTHMYLSFSLGEDWPNNGEVDILEGVNDISPNAATLHTNSGCTMPDDRAQTGLPVQSNCDVAATGNSGCGVQTTEPNSYGPGFNSNGGGYYAMERTDEAISVWFWPRGSEGIPEGVTGGAQSVDTANWGTPSAFFPNTSCDIASKFGAHKILINCMSLSLMSFARSQC